MNKRALLNIVLALSISGFPIGPLLAEEAQPSTSLGSPNEMSQEPAEGSVTPPVESLEFSDTPPVECNLLSTKLVKAGDWRTLESFWNVKATAFFREPAGAQIKVRYGTGWPLGKDGQKQTLDGNNYKKLSVGYGSLSYARMQIRVPSDTSVTYLNCPGTVARNLPTIPF